MCERCRARRTSYRTCTKRIVVMLLIQILLTATLPISQSTAAVLRHSIKMVDSSNDAVYLINRGRARKVNDSGTITALGFQPGKLESITNEEFRRLELGPIVPSLAETDRSVDEMMRLTMLKIAVLQDNPKLFSDLQLMSKTCFNPAIAVWAGRGFVACRGTEGAIQFSWLDASFRRFDNTSNLWGFGGTLSSPPSSPTAASTAAATGAPSKKSYYSTRSIEIPGEDPRLLPLPPHYHQHHKHYSGSGSSGDAAMAAAAGSGSGSMFISYNLHRRGPHARIASQEIKLVQIGSGTTAGGSASTSSSSSSTGINMNVASSSTVTATEAALSATSAVMATQQRLKRRKLIEEEKGAKNQLPPTTSFKSTTAAVAPVAAGGGRGWTANLTTLNVIIDEESSPSDNHKNWASFLYNGTTVMFVEKINPLHVIRIDPLLSPVSTTERESLLRGSLTRGVVASASSTAAATDTSSNRTATSRGGGGSGGSGNGGGRGAAAAAHYYSTNRHSHHHHHYQQQQRASGGGSSGGGNWSRGGGNNNYLQGFKLLDGEGVIVGRTVSQVSKVETGWDYGELRGGSPAHKINDKEYLAFFHSSRRLAGNGIRSTYFLGAYTFSSSPPFRIIRISAQPFMHEPFYSGAWCKRHLDYVLFVSGYIFNYEDPQTKQNRYGNDISDVLVNKVAPILDQRATVTSTGAANQSNSSSSSSPPTTNSPSSTQVVLADAVDYKGINLIVSFGYQDTQGWTAKMAMNDLLRTMVYVTDTAAAQ